MPVRNTHESLFATKLVTTDHFDDRSLGIAVKLLYVPDVVDAVVFYHDKSFWDTCHKTGSVRWVCGSLQPTRTFVGIDPLDEYFAGCGDN